MKQSLKEVDNDKVVYYGDVIDFYDVTYISGDVNDVKGDVFYLKCNLEDC